MMRALMCFLLLVVTPSLQGQVAPQKSPRVAAKIYRHADLDVDTIHDSVDRLPPRAAAQARQSLARMGMGDASAYIDLRGGRFITLTPTEPLVAGAGVGNTLRWPAETRSRAEREQAALAALHSYFATYQTELQLDLSELGEARVTTYDDGQFYQIYLPRTFDGMPVRGSYLSASIRHGNLILMGFHQWSDRGAASNRPRLSREQATAVAYDFLAPLEVTGTWGEARQLYVPLARPQAAGDVVLDGYDYRLVWSVKAMVASDDGRWEILVDAHSGEVLANQDTNAYAEIRGGVLPVSNDGISPDGVEQDGWPMPYQTTTLGTTDTGGNVPGSGSFNATFFGPYVNINDNCGSDSLTQTDNIDWGTSAGTDCATPGFGGAGNTHASRSGFYELNKIIEMARGQLPSNTWLQSRLSSNMNINSRCNAYWNGSTVNFYRSGGGCANTGELAAVFDHEWGHGMDANDATPGIASPSGEGIADIYTALRLGTSCIGRNFRSTVCSGNGDPCLTCTGVRDIDYLERLSGNPHDYTWSNANCGGSVHCVGAVYSEAVWSLWKRELQDPPYDYDNNTAHEIVNRLTFIGAGNTGTWFSGDPPNGGCAAGSGYMNYLAAADDNGNLNDGTPHMTAIYNAFNDQEIACQTPTVQDSGCAGGPTSAPDVSGAGGDTTASLSWSSVSGAAKYQVFRTEGVFACDFGKVKLGETTGTSWSDSGLQNGRAYSYVVLPVGAANACPGPASACTQVTPGLGSGPFLKVPPEIPAAGAPVAVPVEMTTDGTALAGTAFSIDYDQACLTFDPTDADSDGIPDTITVNTPANFHVTVLADLSDTDGEIDISIFDAFAPSPLADGILATVTLTATCTSVPPATTIAPVGFSADPAASFSDTDAQSVAGTTIDGSVEIFSGIRGDCNGDGLVDIADLVAGEFEIFDGDGSFWLDVAAGTYTGNPVGCDANADTAVDVGDLMCKNRLIFDLPCAVGFGSLDGFTGPWLSLPREIDVIGGTATARIDLGSNGHEITSTIFTLDYDETRLSFDPTDADLDGIPDAVRFFGTPVSRQEARFNAADTDAELIFLIADLVQTPNLLADGLLVEVEFQTLDSGSTIEAAVLFGEDPRASFGDTDGRGVPGTTKVVLPSDLFGDGFESGDTSAWSLYLP